MFGLPIYIHGRRPGVALAPAPRHLTGGGSGSGLDTLEQKRLQKGYFFELNEIRDTGGKVFPCSTRLLSSEEALDFPLVKVEHARGPLDNLLAPERALQNHGGTNLELVRDVLRNGSNRSTLVGIYFRENAKVNLRSWTEGYCAKYGTDDANGRKLQVVELCCVESLLFRMGPLKKMLMKGLGENAVEATNYFAAFGKLRGFQQQLQISNRLTAYCFLIDVQGKVRWKGSGGASEDELEKLRAALVSLTET